MVIPMVILNVELHTLQFNLLLFFSFFFANLEQ